MTSQMWMILITVVYVCAMMLLSWIIGKKTTKDETEFMVGGREFTAFMTAIGNGSVWAACGSTWAGAQELWWLGCAGPASGGHPAP